MTALGAVVVLASAANYAAITYQDTIKPILDSHCVECHHEGGRSPTLTSFPFASWDNAAQEDVVIRMIYRVEAGTSDARRMPPGARSLLDAHDLDLLRAWLATGLNP